MNGLGNGRRLHDISFNLMARFLKLQEDFSYSWSNIRVPVELTITSLRWPTAGATTRDAVLLEDLPGKQTSVCEGRMENQIWFTTPEKM